MKMPRNIGPVHFVGIGGIGMSGIAEILHNQGYAVRGSDSAENPNVQRLRKMGIPVEIGQKAENLKDAAVVVISSAIKKGNPELDAARSRGLPVVRRAEMLAEIMRFKNAIAIGGTHGKTTTTTLIATLLDAGNMDPTVINGGIINAYGTNARLGEGEWMVVEADESDGTFVKLPADVAVVTNIDPEHLDHYRDFAGVKRAFLNFVENVPFYGFAVMCLDHPEVQALVGAIRDRRVITYGTNPQADVRLVDLEIADGVSKFAVEIRDRIRLTHLRIEGARAADAGRAQRAQCHRGDRGRRPAQGAGRGDPQGAEGFLRRKSGASPRPASFPALPSSTITAIIRWRSPRSFARRGSRPSATSSPWCSRTATRASTTSSTTSPPASTTPTQSSSRPSMRPASSRSPASRTTNSSPASAPAAIATPASSTGPKPWRR